MSQGAWCTAAEQVPACLGPGCSALSHPLVRMGSLHSQAGAGWVGVWGTAPPAAEQAWGRG